MLTTNDWLKLWEFGWNCRSAGVFRLRQHSIHFVNSKFPLHILHWLCLQPHPCLFDPSLRLFSAFYNSGFFAANSRSFPCRTHKCSICRLHPVQQPSFPSFFIQLWYTFWARLHIFPRLRCRSHCQIVYFNYCHMRFISIHTLWFDIPAIHGHERLLANYHIHSETRRKKKKQAEWAKYSNDALWWWEEK